MGFTLLGLVGLGREPWAEDDRMWTTRTCKVFSSLSGPHVVQLVLHNLVAVHHVVDLVDVVVKELLVLLLLEQTIHNLCI